VLSILAIFYELILIFWNVPLVNLVYGGKYAAFAGLIPFIGMIPIFVALASGFSIMVRSFQSPQYYAAYTAILAVLGLTIVPMFILRWGIAGAISSQLIVELFSLAALIVFYRRLAARYGLELTFV